jgi:hypothetical protein
MQLLTRTNICNTITNFQSKKILFGFYVATILISYYFLVSSGKSYTVIWFNDTMALLDATYRVTLGQIPGTDFYSSIGPLNFYLSAVGLKLGFDPSVTFAIEGILVLLIIFSAGLLVMYSRFSLLMILLPSIFIWLLITVPLGSGQDANNFSWGMFYNRHGWAGLFFILLFYIEPREITKASKWIDSSMLAVLVLFELYCKITYGLVGLGFIFANMLVSKYNRSVSIISLLIIVLSILIIHLAIDIHNGYLDSILRAINSRGAYRGNIYNVINTIIEHSHIIIAVLLAMVYSAFLGCNKLLNWLFVIGSTIVCIILLDQNGDIKGIPSVIAVFLVLAELIRRNNLLSTENNKAMEGFSGAEPICIVIIMTILLVKPTVNRLYSLYAYNIKTTSVTSLTSTPEKITNFLVPTPSRKHLFTNLIAENDFSPNLLSNIRASASDQILSSYEYLITINDGHKLLNEHMTQKGKVFVLDMANPFLFTLALPPKNPGYSFLFSWPSETVDNIFNDITYIMEPKLPFQSSLSVSYKAEYKNYLHSNYQNITSSLYWNLWIKKL